MPWWPEGFRLSLLAFRRPTALAGASFEEAANALLDALTSVPPAGWPFRKEARVPGGMRTDLAPGGCAVLEGTFADPALRIPCPGGTFLHTRDDDRWAEPVDGPTGTGGIEGGFPRRRRGKHPSLIVLPPGVAADRWHEEAARELDHLRHQEATWKMASGENWDTSEKRARVAATSPWLESLPDDVLILLVFWARGWFAERGPNDPRTL
jgi:hypothetical protein